ncbi:MAG TPA: phasin family protein [Xanthobacteraceae bacterium]|nr:phasin family protein [Xanthobacteraceae bacterium]
MVELPRAKKPVEPQADAETPSATPEAAAARVETRSDVPNEAAAPAKQPVPRDQGTAPADKPRDRWLGAVSTMTSVAAKAAADYRSWLTEHMKSTVGGAFGYASGLASLSLSAGRQAANPSVGTREGATTAGAPGDHPAADAATACARAFEAMSANWTAGLDYARRLAEVTSPADLILLSTSQARKQVDLLMEQSAALNALSRALVAAPTDAAKNAADKR